MRSAIDVSCAVMLTRLRQLGQRQPFLFPTTSIPEHFKRSAVLILFWEEVGEVRTLLTRRPDRMSRHAGQVVFAGGLLEGEETFRDAALREAAEEVGLAPSAVEVVGRLDDAWSGSGSHLVPYVAWSPVPPALVANPGEVDEILRPRVNELLQPGARRDEVVETRGFKYLNPVIEWPGGRVFGLTADLLLEALAWATGGTPDRGPERLSDLVSYSRLSGV